MNRELDLLRRKFENASGLYDSIYRVFIIKEPMAIFSLNDDLYRSIMSADKCRSVSAHVGKVQMSIL
jgi:hypothetical protein